MFSNSDYIPKDFTDVRESQIGQALETSRLVDKIARQLNVDRTQIADTLERKAAGLETLKNSQK